MRKNQLARIRLRACRGYSLIEALVVVGLVGILATLVTPLAIAQINRSRLEGAARGIHSVVLAARIQALKRDSNVVVVFDIANRQVNTFSDFSAAGSANNNNGRQDPGEPTIGVFTLPARVTFKKPGGTAGDADSVSFDGYILNGVSTDDRIIFRPDGSIVPPPAANSARPSIPPSPPNPAGSFNCASARGVYVADERGRNFFRISVDDVGSQGKVSLLKSTFPTSTVFGPRPWIWN